MTRVDTVVRQNDSVDSLRGKLLVASPAITDPNFRRAVVLIAEHSADGAMGVVLDRVSEATVGDVVGGLSWLAGDDAEVFVGGPVATTSVTVLAEFRDPARAALLIEDDLGFIPAETEDEAGLAEAVARVRVFAGHAGWAPGQLEEELTDEGWIVAEALREDCFTDDPEGLWEAVLRRQGGSFSLIATMPFDPSLN